MLAKRLALYASQTSAAVIDDVGVCSWKDLTAKIGDYRQRLLPKCQNQRILAVVPQSAEAIALLAALDDQDVTLVSSLYGAEAIQRYVTEIEASVLIDDSGGGFELTSRNLSNEFSTQPGVSLLTSGTTGKAKRIRHDWVSLSAGVLYRSDLSDKRWFSGYPLGHFAGLQVMLQALFNGASLLLPKNFATTSTIEKLREHRPTHLCATPTFVRQLLFARQPDEWRDTSLTTITLGGEIADQPTLDALTKALPRCKVIHTYASTEVGSVMSISDGRAGFDASLIDGLKFRLEDGQLYVRSSGRSMISSQANDWIGTGDVIEIVERRANFLGRISDIINVGGFKVSAALVESVVRAVDGVGEVRVMAHKSAIVGNLIKVTITPSPGLQDTQALKEEISRKCASALPEHMRPRLFEFVEQTDVTSTMKIARSRT